MKSYFRVGGDSEREHGFVLAVARTLELHLRQPHLGFCLHRCRKRLFRCHHALSCHGRCALCQRADVLSERQGEFAFFARHSGRPHLLVRSVRGRRFAERNSAGPRMCYLGSDPESARHHLRPHALCFESGRVRLVTPPKFEAMGVECYEHPRLREYPHVLKGRSDPAASFWRGRVLRPVGRAM